MANNIQWQPHSISLLKFDPTAAISASADAFKGITDTINDRRAASSLAQYRQQAAELEARKQTFNEGADARAEAQRAKSAQRLLGAVSETGYSLVDPFLQRPEIQADFAKAGITDPTQQKEMLMTHLGNDPKAKAIFSAPTRWDQAAYNEVIRRGGSIETAEKARDTVRSHYQTADKDLTKSILAKPGVAGSMAASSVGGSKTKLLHDALNPSDLESLRDSTMGRFKVEKDRMSLGDFRFTDNASYGFGAYDVTSQDVLNLEARLNDELSYGAIYHGVIPHIINDNTDGTTRFDIRNGLKNMTPEEVDALIEVGRNWEIKQEERVLGGRGSTNVVDAHRQILKDTAEYNKPYLQDTLYKPHPFQDRKAILDNMLSSIIPDASVQPTTDGSKILSKAPPQAGKDAPPVIDEATGTATAQILNQLQTPSQGEQLLNQNRGIGGSEQARLLDEQDSPILGDGDLSDAEREAMVERLSKKYNVEGLSAEELQALAKADIKATKEKGVTDFSLGDLINENRSLGQTLLGPIRKSIKESTKLRKEQKRRGRNR